MATTSPQDTASFVVRLVPTDPRSLKTFVTANPTREEFWRATAQIDPDKVDLDINLCESRFLQTFATRLRDTLTARLRTRDGTFEDRGTKPQLLNLPGTRLLRLTIESHEYGSLEAKVLVDGATTIATAFSGRMDLFSAFIEQYTPQVFVAGLPIDPVSERPVSGSLLEADDLAKIQFKAVLDELAKRKSQGQGSAATSASTNQVSAVAPTSVPNQSSSHKRLAVKAVAVNPLGPQSAPSASATTVQVQASVVPEDSGVTVLNDPNALQLTANTTPHALPSKSTTASDAFESTTGRLDVRPYDDRPQIAPQIIMMPQPYISPSPLAVPDQSHGSNRLWIVANLSLLFPVLLALIVLYFTYVGLQAERAQLAMRQADIEKREKEVQQLMLARERQLFEALHPGPGKSLAPSSAPASRASP